MHDYSTALYDVGIQVEVVCATRDIGIQCDFTERITSTPVREHFVPPNFIETRASDDNLNDSSYHDSQCSSVNESLESSQHTSAKYGSYTLMELSSSKIVDFQLVQVRRTRNTMHLCTYV